MKQNATLLESGGLKWCSDIVGDAERVAEREPAIHGGFGGTGVARVLQDPRTGGSVSVVEAWRGGRRADVADTPLAAVGSLGRTCKPSALVILADASQGQEHDERCATPPSLFIFS
jgi:hypothetical protein